MARKTKDLFQFKQFTVNHHRCAHKVGTDGVLLGAWANVHDAKRILDVGTGSGVIALMMAQRAVPDAHIDAIEISQADAEQAMENVAASPWHEQVAIRAIAFQHFESEPYDLIVSNPPFFIDSAKPPAEERYRARHAASLPPVELLTHAKRLMTIHGKLALILPAVEGYQFISLAEKSGWFCNRICEFRSRAHKPVERLLFELHLRQHEVNLESLVLYQNEMGEEWTSAYKNLTYAFYLK